MVAKWEKEWQDKQAKEASEVRLPFIRTSLYGFGRVWLFPRTTTNILCYAVLFRNPPLCFRVNLHFVASSVAS